MPSSFQGKNGRISYIMEAKIARSWHWSSDAQKEIKFMSRSSPHTVQMMVNTALIYVINI